MDNIYGLIENLLEFHISLESDLILVFDLSTDFCVLSIY